MNIDELLDLMEETMEEASGLPFSGSKRMVDIDKMRDIIDEVRLNMPTEIRQAKAIVNDRADIIASAKREAEAIVKKAEDRARVLVGEEQIVRAAQQRAAEILSSAQSQSREMRTTVTDYCENMLRITEEQLARNAAEVKPVRATLRQTAKTNTGGRTGHPPGPRAGRILAGTGPFSRGELWKTRCKTPGRTRRVYRGKASGGKNTQNRKNMQPIREKTALGRDFSRFFFGAISCN